ncbi:MAG: DUF222 domain-containing protein [Streptosporangiaceae bacterium]
MSAEPARGPGRDEDPARHACDRPDTPPAPQAPGPAADVPSPFSTPDWLDHDEWVAMVATRVDEEPADPDLEEDPPDWEGLAAVIAEAREITAAEVRDAAYAAQIVFDGGFGAAGAAPGPRGPGNPGSAASFPGEHGSPAAGFGSGFALDTAPGCLALGEFAATVAGEDDRYPGAADDEVMGVICAWDRVEAHVVARKLAAVAEFIRRRPGEDDAPQDSGQDGAHGAGKAAPKGGGKGAPQKDAPQSPPEVSGKATAQDRGKAGAAGGREKSAAQDPAKGAGPEKVAGGMPPQGWDDFAVKELAWALAESLDAAEHLMAAAYQLEARLPGTKAALRDGRIRASKATAITRATQVLDAKEAAAAEEKVLGRASRLTTPGLRDAIGRAVMEVAPDKARKRREEAAKQTRVERWVEDSGNAGLAGRELPSAQVLAADQRVNAWAKQLRAAGLDGDMDVLRARAFLDILLGMDSRLAAGDAAGPGGPADGGGPDPAGPPDGDEPYPFGLFGPPVPPGAAVLPPGFCGSINLTVPLVTALGLADRPGQAGTLGPIDPWQARDLVRSAAGNPRTTWCLTVTDEDGRAIGHGCARPEPRKRTPRRAGGGGPGPPGGHDPPVPADEQDLHGPRFSFTAAGQVGPPGGYGAWRLSTGIPGQPDLIIAVHPIATDECDHRFQAAGHDPGVMLRHLSQIRHARCTAPTCRRPAASCDFEHNVPYEAGGRTCLCNGGPKCRTDHRLKQDPRWRVEQPRPATFRWTTPAGRQYTTEATQYPI